jgi:hypothetical protein
VVQKVARRQRRKALQWRLVGVGRCGHRMSGDGMARQNPLSRRICMDCPSTSAMSEMVMTLSHRRHSLARCLSLGERVVFAAMSSMMESSSILCEWGFHASSTRMLPSSTRRRSRICGIHPVGRYVIGMSGDSRTWQTKPETSWKALRTVRISLAVVLSHRRDWMK